MHKSGLETYSVYIIIRLKQKVWLFSFHLQNPVLIRLICNQYNKIMNAVSDMQNLVHGYICLFPPPMVSRLWCFTSLPLNISGAPGRSRQPGLPSLIPTSCCPQYSVPTQISQAFPVQPSQHSQLPQLHNPFPARRGEKKNCELKELCHHVWPLTRFLFSHLASLGAALRWRMEADYRLLLGTTFHSFCTHSPEGLSNFI